MRLGQTCGEVAALDHEVLDDSVEGAALVSEALLARAQRAEVLNEEARVSVALSGRALRPLLRLSCAKSEHRADTAGFDCTVREKMDRAMLCDDSETHLCRLGDILAVEAHHYAACILVPDLDVKVHLCPNGSRVEGIASLQGQVPLSGAVCEDAVYESRWCAPLRLRAQPKGQESAASEWMDMCSWFSRSAAPRSERSGGDLTAMQPRWQPLFRLGTNRIARTMYTITAHSSLIKAEASVQIVFLQPPGDACKTPTRHETFFTNGRRSSMKAAYPISNMVFQRQNMNATFLSRDCRVLMVPYIDFERTTAGRAVTGAARSKGEENRACTKKPVRIRVKLPCVA